MAQLYEVYSDPMNVDLGRELYSELEQGEALLGWQIDNAPQFVVVRQDELDIHSKLLNAFRHRIPTKSLGDFVESAKLVDEQGDFVSDPHGLGEDYDYTRVKITIPGEYVGMHPSDVESRDEDFRSKTAAMELMCSYGFCFDPTDVSMNAGYENNPGERYVTFERSTNGGMIINCWVEPSEITSVGNDWKGAGWYCEEDSPSHVFWLEDEEDYLNEKNARNYFYAPHPRFEYRGTEKESS